MKGGLHVSREMDNVMRADATSQSLRAVDGEVRANEDVFGFGVEVVDRDHLVRTIPL